jgi:Xaa-Pro aminopeptidase
MKYTPLSKSLYQTNRSKFAVKLKPDSEEVFHSNDLIPTNADGTMKFRQNNDLLYLTGIDQGVTILTLAPDCPIPPMR